MSYQPLIDKSNEFQSLTIDEVFKLLATSPQGLHRSEVEKRLAFFGKNIIEEEKINKFAILARQFNNILIYVLFIASVVSVLIGELTDFFIINSIILINGLIGFWQELKAEASIAALKKLTESSHKVVRDGEVVLIHSSELVPGDYLILHEGEVITADMRLVESSGLTVDESAMTGESVPVVKDPTASIPSGALPYELTNVLLAGTCIVRGSGRGIVVKTGSRTYLSTIAAKGAETSPETPLTKALSFFTKRYVWLLILLLSLLGGLGYLQGRKVLDLAYILLASLVSAVPEGLPIVITMVMVIGAIALSKKQALIRYLPSVETLGSATVIASDKTGTITEGQLIVKCYYSQDFEKLKFIAALCNDSHEGTGDPLDVALADWVENFNEIRKQCPRRWAYAFDARLMLMATINQVNEKEELFVKGAYESLKDKVENKEELKDIEKAMEAFFQQGLRVLAFGVGKTGREDPSSWKIKIIGIIGFLDPPKEGVKEAVASAKQAGIHVVMITGDHPMTARAVAEEVGIWKENDQLLTGKEIENFDDGKLLHSLKSATVLARILPEHKYRVVKLLQKNDEIVAVTGDGVNDVPALKAADIGIAMGGGTEAAKSASKMVITDNNLKVIIEAIKNARVIADNIRKVIYYLVSTSLQELCLISLAILFALPLPLSAIQILWVNLVSDGVQDKTFAFAKAEGNVMRRLPRKPEKQFFDLKQVVRIITFGLMIGLICFFLYRHLLQKYPFEITSTIMFTSTVVAQWANGIQSQKEEEPFFKNLTRSFDINPLIFVGCGAGVILQCFVIYIIPKLFHSIPLNLDHWKYPAFVFLSSFGFVEIRKWIEFVWNKRQYRIKRPLS